MFPDGIVFVVDFVGVDAFSVGRAWGLCVASLKKNARAWSWMPRFEGNDDHGWVRAQSEESWELQKEKYKMRNALTKSVHLSR